jgi:enoyl-CoA hydratase/carnithine racemase
VDLRVELASGVLALTVDREDRRNALNEAVLDGMHAAVTAPPPEARVVLVRSAGDRAFCAGADLAVMTSEPSVPCGTPAPGRAGGAGEASHPPPSVSCGTPAPGRAGGAGEASHPPPSTGLELHVARGGLRRVVEAMRSCPLPVVARVQGLCLAGGVGLALGCDLVVAADTASFGLPEVNLGLWPFMVSALLTRHVSPKVAMDLMLTGRRIGAAEALAVGLVSRVVPSADLDAEVDGLLRDLAAKPPMAVRLGKAAFASAAETAGLPHALEAMQAQLSLLTQTADAAEGVAAFFGKREPKWSGR